MSLSHRMEDASLTWIYCNDNNDDMLARSWCEYKNNKVNSLQLSSLLSISRMNVSRSSNLTEAYARSSLIIVAN